jgi:cytochrome c oxidase assembly protein subunit 15
LLVPSDASRPVRLWLWCVAGLVFITVIVGGATRLTESGLSIVEWRPVTGMLPPLSQADWAAEFEKYKVIPQYELVNRGMSLDDFKTIYWWEWAHRILGRLIGVAFLLPFLWFLWRGAIGPGMRTGLAVIFSLGALQGGVGWWMVSSGLADRIHVSHDRLAFHFTLACIIYAAIIWTAARLLPAPAPAAAPVRLRVSALVLVALTLVQFYFGALVAGLRAGLVYNTWPLMEDRVIPRAADLFFAEPIWVNFVENTMTVQFAHRMAGYVLLLGALAHLVDVWRTKARGDRVLGWAAALVLAMLVQLALGIFTLIHHVPIDLALLHQAGALIVLTIAVLHAERLTPRREARAPQAQPALDPKQA